MPIKVACQCGQSFAAPDHLAGRTVKCPKCGQPLSIPAPQAQQPATPVSSGLADLFAEEGLAAKAGSGPQCPSCSSPMPSHGFICVQCGYNVQLGRKVKVADSSAMDSKAEAARMLAKARKEIELAPDVKTASDYGAGWEAYMMAGALVVATMITIALGYGAFLVLESIYPEEPSFYTTLYISFFFTGLLFYLLSWIELLIRAFSIHYVQGLLCLFVPLYGWGYSIVKAGMFQRPLFLGMLSWAFFQYCGVFRELDILTQAKQDINFLGLAFFSMAIVGFCLIYWGWVRVTGLAFEDEDDKILHGVLCFTILAFLFPVYAIIYGLFLRKDNQAYADAGMIIAGYAVWIGMIVCIFAVAGLSASKGSKAEIDPAVIEQPVVCESMSSPETEPDSLATQRAIPERSVLQEAPLTIPATDSFLVSTNFSAQGIDYAERSCLLAAVGRTKYYCGRRGHEAGGCFEASLA